MDSSVYIACVKAQKDAIRESLDHGLWKTKDSILSYFDNCPFYGHAIKQTKYKSLTAYLNRICKTDELIKLHNGSGSFARYTFPKNHLSYMIDEVISEAE